MIKRTGHADLPLHTGTVPRWLADRMRDLGILVIEALVLNYGKREVLRRLADPLWFQSFGAALGMDWHSSGITTSVMYALKRGINPRARELGLCVCGGRGKYSRKTPDELLFLGDRTGLDAPSLIRASKLCAKTDNTAVQDGFQLYQHNFILSNEGEWTVVQQGMNAAAKSARRYHWCSQTLTSFVEEPHTGITGEAGADILNLTAREASATRGSILSIAARNPQETLAELRHATLFSPAKPPPPSRANTRKHAASARNIEMPVRHFLKPEDIDLKRLGAILIRSYEASTADFETLLLTPGLGPRTLQALCLVSEIMHGTPSRFQDPARFSFAHGGKDGHPFPVATRVYDESIRVLSDAIEKSKLGYNDKSECIRRLHATALQIEKRCEPEADFQAVIDHERKNSAAWGGRSGGGT